MHQSQITLAKDVDLQTEIIQYIMSKCLDNFERSLILIDCAQVNAKYKPEYKMTTKHFFSLSTRCRGKSWIILQTIRGHQSLYLIVHRFLPTLSKINIDSLLSIIPIICTWGKSYWVFAITYNNWYVTYRMFRLSSLPNEYFPALACQMLRVTQISETLTAGIIYKSFGNPGWTLLILKSLLDQE